MRAAPVSNRGIVELAGLLSRGLDQFLDVRNVARRAYGQYERYPPYENDRVKILLHVVRQARVKMRGERKRTAEAVNQGVAVGRCLGDLPDRERPTGRRPVLYHDRLAETLAQFVGEGAGRNVHSTACNARVHQ